MSKNLSAAEFLFRWTQPGLEMEVKKLSKLRSIYIYQPSMLLGDRQEFRLMESIGKFLMGIFSFIIPKSSKAILDDQVAYSMMNNGLNPKKGVHVISNAEMINASNSVA